MENGGFRRGIKMRDLIMLSDNKRVIEVGSEIAENERETPKHMFLASNISCR